MAPYHASQMFSSNVATFLKNLLGFLPVTAQPSDEIVRDTLVTHEGKVVHAKVCEVFGWPAPGPAAAGS